MNTQAVSEWESEIQRRRATLLNYLLLTTAVIGVVAIAFVYASLPEGLSTPNGWTTMAPFFAGWLAVLIVWAWRGLDYHYRALVFILLAYVLGVIIFARGGLPGSGRVWMLLLPALAFVLSGLQAGIAAGAISILTYAFFTLAISQKWIVPQVAEDLTTLTPLLSEGGSFLLVAVILTIILWSFYQSWLEALAGTSIANKQLQAQTRELEEANERLHRQASQLQATAEITKAGSSILDPEKLLTEVVHQIQEGFSSMGVYYVGLFLLEGEQRFATLRAATGEAGQLSLEMGYKLELDETSTVGWCIVHREPRIALDVEEKTVRFDALSMPHTRSEVALPLRSRGNIMGALSVQSEREAAFSEADISVLQTMADQVAVAIDNARLFSQTEAALEEVQTIQRRYLSETWEGFLATEPVTRIDYAQPGTEPGNGSLLREIRREAMAQGQTIATEPKQANSTEGTALVVPLKLREQVIGTIAMTTESHETHQQQPWTAEEIAMAETVAEQVALTIDNLRLFEETQRRAARERLVGELSEQMQRAMDLEDLMRITAEGLNEALGGSRTFVRMGMQTELADGDESGHKSQEKRQ